MKGNTKLRHGIKISKSCMHEDLSIKMNYEFKKNELWPFTDEGMDKFRQLTEKNEHLQMIWKHQNITIDQAYGKWSKELNSITHHIFHKRRIKHSHNTQILPKLFKELRKIKKTTERKPNR